MVIVIWSGLVLGAVYALVAAGFTLTLIPTGVFNFAQGAVVVGGSYLGYEWLSAHKWPHVAAIVATIAAGLLIGLVSELLAVRPLRWRGGVAGTNTIVTTVGLSTALAGIFGVKWSYDPLQVPFFGPSKSIHTLGINITPVQIVIVGAAIVVAIALQAWFRLTRAGQACLAVAENRDAATLRGVNVNRISLLAFAIAGALGAFSGLLTGPYTYAQPQLGTTLALGGFVALVIGGELSFVGGLVGGLLVGLVSSFAGRYLQASYSDISVLALLAAALVLRPRGFGGERDVREV
jgi:branched-chain amino acid transport system permease protein